VGEGPANYGQTVVFPGGPGYSNSTAATPLNLQSATTSTAQGQTFTTYTFDNASVVSILSLVHVPGYGDVERLLGPTKVETGVKSLTYSGSSPASLFSNQRIAGFYRDPTWKTCLGLPMYDYGTGNANFASTATGLNDPILIYDPTAPFLNGNSLQNVFRELSQATYVYGPDKLLSTLNLAIAAKQTDSGGAPSCHGRPGFRSEFNSIDFSR
jgi:hypothetical protein